MFQRAFSSTTYGKNILLQVERVKLLLPGQVKPGELHFFILVQFCFGFCRSRMSKFFPWPLKVDAELLQLVQCFV